MGTQRRRVLAAAIAGLAAILAAAAAAGAPPARAQQPPLRAADEARIDELLGRMTLAEKLGQLQMLSADFPSGELAEEQLELVREGAQPVRELRGFERVTLRAGERRRLRFELGPEDLALHDASGAFTVEPGRFEVFAGTSSEGGLEAAFEVGGG